MVPMNDVLLAGSTGLIGRELVALLARELASRRGGATLHLLVRRAVAAPPGTLVHVVDFAALPALPKAREAYCALGTTIAQAGSQAAFRAVDHDAVLAFARAARTAGVKRFAVVSALGANAGSVAFYNRVKGETEAALQGLGFETLVIVRPSLLLGDRASLGQPLRPGERVGAAVASLIGPLIPRGLRPIKVQTVARGMLDCMKSRPAGVHVVESGELQQMDTT
jgi:uncharacterized protein YbjT (DUF2867 family)